MASTATFLCAEYTRAMGALGTRLMVVQAISTAALKTRRRFLEAGVAVPTELEEIVNFTA